MYSVIRILLTFLFFFNLSYASSNRDKFEEAKQEYASIILQNDKQEEARALKKIIFYGEKTHRNVNKYKKELQKLHQHIIIEKPTKNIVKQVSKVQFSIEDVVANDDSITITFNKNISKSDIRYFTKKLRKYHQYVFDINGRFERAKPTKLTLDEVDKIKIVQFKYDTLRITINNKNRLKLIYIIGTKKIIIKLIKKQKSTKIITSYNKPIIEQQKDKKVIVIDAGHGGKDSGAVGIHNYYEKDITLNTAIHLYKILRKRGYEVYLTRARDKFITLRHRTKLANDKNADIFISIHANAVPRSKRSQVEGIETYFLSPARSERAKHVAALENASDMNNMGWTTQNIFLDVLNRSKITASQKVAIDIQKNILYTLRNKYGEKNIVDGGVKEGPFWVLVGTQMPCVLIEVGYITHPVEGRRIHTNEYQNTMAFAIANGIDSYFLKNQ